MQAFPLKGILKTTPSRCLLARRIDACFFFLMYQVDSIRTLALYIKESNRSVILITIKVLNIGTDRSDPDQTALNYEQSEQGLHCFVIPSEFFLPVNAITAIKKVMYDRLII